MKLTVWKGFKLGAWLITSFLLVLMITVYMIDYKDSSMSIMFYFNKFLIIILMWIFLYFFKFLIKKLNDLNEK